MRDRKIAILLILLVLIYLGLGLMIVNGLFFSMLVWLANHTTYTLLSFLVVTIIFATITLKINTKKPSQKQHELTRQTK